MKRTALWVCGIILLIAVGFGFGKNYLLHAEISVPDFVDLGPLECGETAPFEVEIKNQGAVTLKLSHFHFSCTCLVTNASTVREIKPGAVATLLGEVQVPRQEGPWERSGAFRTNDPRRPTHSFKIRSIATRKARIIPEILVLNSESLQTGGEVKLEVGADLGPIKAVDLESGCSYFHFKVEKIDGATAKILCDIDEHSPSGELDSYLDLTITCQSQKIRKRLKVGGMLKNDYKAFPSCLVLKKHADISVYDIRYEGPKSLKGGKHEIVLRDAGSKLNVEVSDNVIQVRADAVPTWKYFKGGSLILNDPVSGKPALSLPIYLSEDLGG